MDGHPTIVTDPLGNQIRLSETFIASLHNYDEDIKRDFSSVLTRPALIIESKEGAAATRYYFRALSWTLNLLITTSNMPSGWTVTGLEENPDTNYLAVLLKNGEQIFRL